MSCRLDANVVEWRLLTEIQPLFAGPVPWDLAIGDVGAAAAAVAITAEKVKTVFASQMGEMRINLIDLARFDLEQQSYSSCRDKIRRLLELLEEIVLDHVLDDPDGQAVEASPVEEYRSVCPSNPVKKTLTDALRNSICSWLGIQAQDLENSSTRGTADFQCLAPDTSKQPFPKLQALARFIIKRSGQSPTQTWVASCSAFLKLQLTLVKFEQLKAKATRVNRVIDGLPQRFSQMNSGAPRPPNIARTQWESTKAFQLTNCLYRLLRKAICIRVDEHKTELQLNGFELDQSCANSSLSQNMIVVSCPKADVLDMCHCTFVSQPFPNLTALEDTRDQSTRHYDVPEAILSDLCGLMPHVSSRPFKISFDDEDLWYSKTRDPSSAGLVAANMVSLEYLLEHGFFSKDREGDVFSLNDKAVLALSLARCLVHLWPGRWVRGPWTTESIKFMCTTNHLLDRHYPYLTCSVTKSDASEGQDEDRGPDHLQLSVLSLAGLLAEIETGLPIQSNLASDTIESFKDEIDDAMEPTRNQFGRGYYNTAIQKCLQFMVLLKRGVTYEQGDFQTTARNIFYHNIIKPLEDNFGQIPYPATVMKPQPLNLGRYTTESSALPPGINATKLSTSHRNGAAMSSINLGMERDHQAVMFFDEESTASSELIDRADFFLDAFKRFQRRHIDPKTRQGRGGRRRTRIAVLDTGIDMGNEGIRGLVDEIMNSRRMMKCPKADRNPIREIGSFTGDNGSDDFGHGTLVAGLILQTAPEADIFVAKVSGAKSFTNMKAVAEAIDWAIKREVDIINMSFGCEFDVHSVVLALDRTATVKHPRPILLAAASNNGRNSQRTFPARHKDVIAIHALDGKGNDNGGMNPSRRGHHDNFGTLGLGIRSLGDASHSSPDTASARGPQKAYKSGTSYATPIAAGIVANCIEWIGYMRDRDHMTAHQYRFLRGPDGIRLMLKKQSETVGDILSIAPWILWKEDPLDTVGDGGWPREVTEKADKDVLVLLLEDMHPIMWD
ncbi:hypothetical protein HIM_06829 [Hirsutella minnesotensis 3608]|uniref:Uncharacterized protein n=1 Tax=Hirsutella minnesotensis 3608 TaxID=1043627 RepID=A0A0F7ZIH8_9HYPO|nr:hypothetical protein HIM_06829 [Hirsutella minnesotensis 3608]